MYLTAVTPADEALLKEQVEGVLEEYKGDVLRIRHDIGLDWDREPQINFRIVLSDKVAKSPARLKRVSLGVIQKLFKSIQSGNSGLFPRSIFEANRSKGI